MAVIINDMAMPESCARCPVRKSPTGAFICTVPKFRFIEDVHKRPDWCPMEEVHEMRMTMNVDNIPMLEMRAWVKDEARIEWRLPKRWQASDPAMWQNTETGTGKTWSPSWLEEESNG